MDVVLSDINALRAYRIARFAEAPFRIEPSSERPSDFVYVSSNRLAQLLIPFLTQWGIAWDNEPIHLRFPSAAVRHRPSGVRAHTMTAMLPEGSCWRLTFLDSEAARFLRREGIRVFVDCPELLVLHAAFRFQQSVHGGVLSRRVVPIARTIAIASEFCGTFSLNPSNPKDGRPMYETDPLMTASDLQAFLDDLKGANGLDTAKRAARYVADLQGSPMEVALHAGLVLKPSLGGFHLERPTTNGTLNPNEILSALMKHGSITPDFYWEQYGLVIEYDGGDHFSVQGAREDKRRVFDYQALKLTVLPATDEDMRSVGAFDSFVKVVTRVMEQKDGPSLRRRVNKILADKEARLCRSLLLSSIKGCV